MAMKSVMVCAVGHATRGGMPARRRAIRGDFARRTRASSLRAAEEDEEDDTQHDQVSENGTH